MVATFVNPVTLPEVLRQYFVSILRVDIPGEDPLLPTFRAGVAAGAATIPLKPVASREGSHSNKVFVTLHLLHFLHLLCSTPVQEV